jgi:uroporphyrinogen-III synthase
MAPRPHRVLITRSSHQSSELAERLRALGAEPVLIPAIEIVEPTSFADLDAALSHLDAFHWLLFTSANAVEAFDCRREGQAGGLPRIAAIGPSTARALEAAGLRPDLIPSQAVAEALAEALLPHARQPDGSPTRFLLLRAESGGDTPPREHLPETLRAAGADVTVASAYRTVIPEESIRAVRAVFSVGSDRIAAITFTSSSTVHNLLALCAAAGTTLPLEPLRVSIGPITGQTLREAGYPADAEAPEATVAALAETVLKALAARKDP